MHDKDKVLDHLKTQINNDLKDQLEKHKDVKLTRNVAEDFPELLDDEDDKEINLEHQEQVNEYLKKAAIEEIVENIEIKKDNSIYDKRLKRQLWRRILDAIFLND